MVRSIGTRIGRALAKRDTKLRKVFFDDECLEILIGDQNTGYTVIDEYVTGWFLDKHEYSDVVAGKKYKRLVIDDVDGCRLRPLRLMTAVRQGGVVFKFVAKDSFIGSVPSYEFRLQATGERV
jgi:hypothetical protein